MKASAIPDCRKVGGRGAQPTVVALAIRDRALSASLAARLAVECDLLVRSCPVPESEQIGMWLQEQHADVLLLEERLIPQLHARREEQSVLIVGARACTALVEQVLRHRFQGFLLAATAPDMCVKAVRTVKRGETWIPRDLLVELLLEHVRAHREESVVDPSTKLTQRETQIIAYVRRGFANKQIAEALAITEDTVKKHLRNAYTKLGVHRRSEIMTADRRLFVI